MYGGVTDARGRLVAGAAYCQMCRLKVDELRTAWGIAIAEGTCHENKSVPGFEGCVRPCPELAPRNRRVWKLFQDTEGHNVWRGMDGIPTARLYTEVESLARARRIAWDEDTESRFRAVEQLWLLDWYRRAEAERKKSEAERPRS